jgi:hypothetical protein
VSASPTCVGLLIKGRPVSRILGKQKPERRESTRRNLIHGFSARARRRRRNLPEEVLLHHPLECASGSRLGPGVGELPGCGDLNTKFLCHSRERGDLARAQLPQDLSNGTPFFL